MGLKEVEGVKLAKTAAGPDVSDFEATLAMLPPRLAARLSLGPSRDASPQASSRASTPLERGSEGSSQISGSQARSSGASGRTRRYRPKDRSWAGSGQFPDLESPPGLPLPGRGGSGALPSPPYSAEVDRSFLRHGHPNPNDGERQLASSASPPLQVRAHQQRPHSSHSAGVTPARQPRQPPNMQVVRAGTRAAGVLDQPSEDGLCTDSTGPPGKALSPQLDISTSSASDRPPASAPTKAADISAEVEKLQNERALADEQAQQMAMQAQTLLQEKADMAARLAEQERQNRDLLQKLEYMQACIAEGGEGASAEEAEYYRDALAQTEAEKEHIIRAYYERIGELPPGDITAA
ncbi:g11857 [Coccomyxa viridis]|uniref:G11857 protein n=1 Tax=Coccomyxa viridis TaxID=1274662 RepID=A0ABP1GA29_9CHLO